MDKTAFTPKEVFIEPIISAVAKLFNFILYSTWNKLNGKTFIEVQKYYNGAEAGYACIQQSFTADDENNGFSYERIGTT